MGARPLQISEPSGKLHLSESAVRFSKMCCIEQVRTLGLVSIATGLSECRTRIVQLHLRYERGDELVQLMLLAESQMVPLSSISQHPFSNLRVMSGCLLNLYS